MEGQHEIDARIETLEKELATKSRTLEIEAALEKVRSRSLAMRKSDELKEVIVVVLENLQALNVTMVNRSAVIIEFEEGSKDFIQWVASPQHASPLRLRTPYFDTVIFSDFWDAKERGINFYTKSYSVEEKNSFFKYSFDHFGKTIPDEEKKWILSCKHYDVSVAIEKNSATIIANHSGELVSEEGNEILKRFARVFDQGYIRFLDLQKAEGQAREAQIQLALERVRARTMAMQKSEELKEVAGLLFRQVSDLGIKAWTTGFNVWSEDNNLYEDYVTSPDGGFMEPYTLDTTTLPVFREISDAKKKGENFFVQCVEGETVKEIYRQLTKFGKKQFEKLLQDGFVFPSKQVHHFVFGSKVSLMFITYEPLPEAHEIFKRFGKVFEQTYTRFLDLQKAEAQAREAKIEMALEKVRSRSLAMHHSSEITDVVGVLFEKLKELGLAFDGGAAIILFTEGSKDAVIGVISPELSVPTFHALPYDEDALEDNPILQDLWRQKYEGGDMINKHYSFEQKNRYFNYVFKHNDESKLPKHVREFILNAKSYTATFIAEKNSLLGANSWSEQLFSENDINVLKRLARVFEQAYIRFLDLQKAEAQARESLIEAALEKIRSASLAMQRSHELKNVVAILFEKLKELGLVFDGGAGIHLFNENSRDATIWVVSPMSTPVCVNLPYDEEAFVNNPIILDVWKAKETGEHIFNKSYPFEEKNVYFNYVFKHNDFATIPKSLREFILQADSYTASVIAEKNSLVAANSWTQELFSENDFEVLKRIGRVFEQAYIRFLDLQKAEAQAREAQIQLALERVRARTNSMQKSEELQEVVHTVLMKLKELNIEFYTAIIILFAEGSKDIIWWLENKEEQQYPRILIPYADIAYLRDLFQARENGRDHFFKTYFLEEKNELFHHLFSHTDFQHAPETQRKFLLETECSTMSVAIGKNTGIHLTRYADKPFSEEDNEILKRFAKVFEQSYTRFLDLQKAEAQAREAQIEAALEKVRSRSLAMHHSNELEQVVASFFDRVAELGVSFDGARIFLFEKQKRNIQLWIGAARLSAPLKIEIPYDKEIENNAIFKVLWNAIEKGEHILNRSYSGETKNTYFRYVWKCNEGKYPESILQFQIESNSWTVSYAVEKNSIICLDSWSGHFISDEDFQILIRFARVFDQAYIRFLDLQKAEEQAREAQIEAALERVRARTMAMQKSNEHTDAAMLMFKQFKELGVNAFACGFVILDKSDAEGEFWMSSEGVFQPPHYIPHMEEPSIRNMYMHWKNKEEFYAEDVGGEALKAHYKYLISLPKSGSNFQGLLDAGINFPEWQRMYAAYFSHGCLLIITKERYKEENIFIRFAKVFEQTYTRFLDLQKAEAQVREAIKRASVDRVRAEIASMRSTNDLERITPLIWNELTTLGVPFIRCGVFIMDDEQQQIETHLSTPDGKALATFNLPYNAPGETAQILEHWYKKELYKQHWNEAQFVEFTQNLVQQGRITSGEKYLTENHPTDLYLHFLPFLQGMLYVGNTKPLSDDALQLVQNLADAFSTAYARYEDFNKLEAAKQQVERTLVDLRQAQQQLIQSEKMASLGELTAGVAHEIQNPLNFVNNFSEVNTELVDELEQAAEKGNIDEIKTIAKDIKENEQKINHHGKRADAIVKGMLQHSRVNTGQKEPTDIDALADEYLRLSYHGMRAKDKSFNVTLQTEFDTNIGKIKVVPQDIGRVLLNLFNNAFYAITERRKLEGEAYEPFVSICTKKVDGKVMMHVKDNGLGIPQKAVDKIFQPFFTTKPTGQGTGLGLSLSYDIVKAHGGEITVETKEGEGSQFTVNLPI